MEHEVEQLEAPEAGSLHLISGHRLARNTVWNLIGNIAPMLIAFFCIPVLVRSLGTERFGILTLVWALIGYTAVFDLGLSRALTQLVAKRLGTDEQQDVPHLVWTSQIMMLFLGFAGTAVLVGLSKWLVRHALHVPVALETETTRALYVLAFSIPFVISSAGLRGLLEAHQRFGVTNALRIPMGVFTYVGPLLVLPFSNNLVPVVGALLVGRFITWAGHLFYCAQIVPELRRRIAYRRDAIRPLLQFGGWMTVSNVVGPLMVTLDRFVIAALVSVTAVAYYATPFDVITKLWLVPGALLGVMFPAFSVSFVQDRSRTALLYGRSVKFLLLILFPAILVVIVMAEYGLKLWLGPEFAAHSTRVLQWLAAGVFINCLAQVPFALVQGVGRPDLTAKVHLIELPGYLAALWMLSKMLGIEGAAVAWTVRVLVDALVLFAMARHFLPSRARISLQTALVVVSLLLIMALGAHLQGLLNQGIFLLVTISGFALLTWFVLFSPEDRALALRLL